MSPITIDLPEDLAERLAAVADRLPQILELGLREYVAGTQTGFAGASDVLEFLAALPTPEEALAFRPTQTLEARVAQLLSNNRADGLTPEEEQEWQAYEYLEHLVRIAKARALARRNAG